MLLRDLFTQYGSDKNTHHSYGPFYEELLADLGVGALLEVGIAGGGSLRAWRDWFPDSTVIVGLDHHANPGPIPGVTQVRADSTNRAQVDAALRDAKFDVIIDDGCHWIPEQKATWENLWHRVRPGGVYVIEDIQAIQEAAPVFVELGAKMIDRRHVKNRQDDVLALWRKPEEAV